jgi:hypothetical protein
MKGKRIMNTRNMHIEENDLLELTDGELESACGGSSYHSNPFSHNFNNSNFSVAPVNQYAYANSSFGNVNLPLLSSVGSGSGLNFGGSSQATNYYNYSVGYVAGQ